MDNIPTQAYLDRLVVRLKSGTVFINTNNGICRPYTLVDKDSDSLAKVWCLIHDRFESIDSSSIINYIIHEEGSAELVQKAKDNIASTSLHDISQEDLENLYFRIDIDDRAFKLLQEFKFAVDIDSIRSDNLSDDELTALREVWTNKIREHRERTFAELDELEEEARNSDSGEDDLEDIQTIKQMFRDIPQDVDLDQYKTVKELVEFWPSLLLPAPDAISLLREQLERVSGSPQSSPKDELLSIINTIDDAEFFTQLLQDLDSMEGDQDNIALAKDKISERLSQLQPAE